MEVEKFQVYLTKSIIYNHMGRGSLDLQNGRGTIFCHPIRNDILTRKEKEKKTVNAFAAK